MNKTIYYLAAAALLLATSAQANDDDVFSELEQQQISIETEGLFEYSNTFSVNFASLRPEKYCFPLPVGKATLAENYDLEIETKKGDAVKAMFDGIVRIARRHPTLGNVVVIRHDIGLETVYAYNAENLTQVGDHVKSGQTIAIVGEHDERTMCLFSVMVDGRKINPETLIDIGSHKLRLQKLICEKMDDRVDIRTERPETPPETANNDNDVVLSNGMRYSDIPINGPAPTAHMSDPVSSKVHAPQPYAKKGEVVLDLRTLRRNDWAYPLASGQVSSPFGGKRHHGGVDLCSKPKDRVLAAFDGVVTRAAVYYGYGNCIVIQHANGLETLYGHQTKNMVKVGQRVRAGQVIGLTGNTGRATGDHLHFEVRVNGRRIDPSVVFDHQRHTLQPIKLLLYKSGQYVKAEK